MLFGCVVNWCVCYYCNGMGKIIKDKCVMCYGDGKVIKWCKINVKILVGVDDG